MNSQDNHGQTIRFGCGFAFGFFTVGLSSIGFLYLEGYYALAIALVVGFIFGFFAMGHGDRFWHYILGRWWWPP